MTWQVSVRFDPLLVKTDPKVHDYMRLKQKGCPVELLLCEINGLSVMTLWFTHPAYREWRQGLKVARRKRTTWGAWKLYRRAVNWCGVLWGGKR
jgi:hypothetical protein